MPAVMSNNLKRVKQFMRPDGTIQNGSAEDYYLGNDVGGNGQADKLPEEPKAKKEEN